MLRNFSVMPLIIFSVALLCCADIAKADHIGRQQWVSRHNVVLKAIDPHAPLMLGNGNIGFTADITGLQSFPQAYAPLAPLLIETQWAWHSFPNPQHYSAKNTLVPVEVRGKTQFYPYMQSWDAAQKNPALNYIRENPHRFSLGRFGFEFRHRDGRPMVAADIEQPEQKLDLWRGVLLSRFRFDGEWVEVRTFVHPGRDAITVTVSSPLLADGRLRLIAKFPGVSPVLNPDPSDWEHPQKHVTRTLSRKPGFLALARRIDDSRYYVGISADADAAITPTGPHRFEITAPGGSTHLAAALEFSRKPVTGALNPSKTEAVVAAHWNRFWSEGGAVDLSGSSDPRALELERRIVLSLYLTAINGAGEVPPQEEGLFSNSWNGKFHLEMHPWHAAHFALWGHPELLERSMGWYLAHLADAKARAHMHGVKGAWWPKMVGPDGVDSPSKVSPFLMWQQPHPILFAELLYRAHPNKETLQHYGALVSETAGLLASYPHRENGKLVLGPPLIPAQENWDPMTTFNPAFELAYFRFGIETAQKWRERAGLKRRADWDAVLAELSPLPQADGLILPAGSRPHFWQEAASEACRGHADKGCMNLDHPSFLMAFGYLPGEGVSPAVMACTLDETMRVWDLRQTWGWDYPMMAMTAARLHRPGQAVDLLFYPGKNNQWGITGMTPRVHTVEHGASFVPAAAGGDQPSPDGPGYRRAAETYFPSNGGLLLAVALMAAGWDGETAATPGFPESWSVRADGIKPLP